jgi:hypothetical protein
MRKDWTSAILSLALVIPATATGTAVAQDLREPPGFLGVEQVVCYEAKVRLRADQEGVVLRRFNEGRPYAISINRHLPDARARLVRDLAGRGRLRSVVFERFGTEVPGRLNILIGSEVPIEVAQSAIAAYAAGSELPVSIAAMAEDAGHNDTHRIYVGGLCDLGGAPMRPEKIQALLDPGLTREQMVKLLPKRYQAAPTSRSK